MVLLNRDVDAHRQAVNDFGFYFHSGANLAAVPAGDLTLRTQMCDVAFTKMGFGHLANQWYTTVLDIAVA